jgi:tRNA (mo5U34)-methyltransferase
MSSPAPPRGYGPEWNKLLEQTGWWHSFELADGSVIRGVNSLESLKDRAAAFPIPQDLRGRRVLDIGAWDGWFSFEMERRGADVVAIDCFDNPRFREIHAIYKSRVDYRQMDVYEITPQTVGRFDFVLFLGVLYHLKHPLLASAR